MTDVIAQHWENIYASKMPDGLSWYQAEPVASLELIEQVARKKSAIVDVGAGASLLIDRLIDRGFTDMTVVDISKEALGAVQNRLAHRTAEVRFVTANVLEWNPDRHFDVWHDRAVFHFLTVKDERDRYVALARSSIRAGGHLILATFAQDGPTQCSGLNVCRYNADQLASQFSDGFKLIHTKQEEHITPSEAIQKFTWVVLERESFQ